MTITLDTPPLIQGHAYTTTLSHATNRYFTPNNECHAQSDRYPTNFNVTLGQMSIGNWPSTVPCSHLPWSLKRRRIHLAILQGT
jgi:hypothetical protein